MYEALFVGLHTKFISLFLGLDIKFKALFVGLDTVQGEIHRKLYIMFNIAQ